MGFSRRTFLKTLVISAGGISLGGLSGCNDSDSGNTASQPSAPAEPVIRDGAVFFPQSVASGDPKPGSVILWTRVSDPDAAQLTAQAVADLTLIVQVARDSDFVDMVAQAELSAESLYDHCVRVKITGLSSRTHYYYRFLYVQGETYFASRTGRTKTAPAPGDDVPVRFAYASCQDYIGRYYNSYLPLLQDDQDNLDFVIHLGDYIYETTGDPSFQQASAERSIQFADTAGAITLGEGDGQYFAAASLDNYRQLHRTYRSDPVLQQVHERFPLVTIWDDHEFSDDCWQDHATYFNALKDEQETTRKHNAEQAWLEYMPIDDTADPVSAEPTATSDLNIGPEKLFPNAHIYRDLRFGMHLHLALLDSRSQRPDHLIPEDAFPGAVVLNEPTLQAALGPDTFAALRDGFFPYADFAALDPTIQGTLLAIVTQLYLDAGLSPIEAQSRATNALQGELDAVYLNALLAGAGLPPEQLLDTTAFSRGLSYLTLGKQELFSSLGSRNMAVQPSFDLFVQILAGIHNENVLGDTQETWLKDTLGGSTATWKFIGSSVSFTSMVLDLTSDPDTLPIPEEAKEALRILQTTPFANRFYLSVDQWDGFPTRRAELLAYLRQFVPNTILLSGDIHASFVTNHSNTLGSLFEFTGPSISSSTFQSEVDKTVTEIPDLSQIPGIDSLTANLSALLVPSIAGPLVQQQIQYLNTANNGVVVVEADGGQIRTSYYLLPAEETAVSHYADPDSALSMMTVKRFQVANGNLTELS